MRKSLKVVALAVASVMVLSLVSTGCGKTTTAENTAAAGAVSTVAEKSEPAAEVKKVTIRYGLWGSEIEQSIQKEAAKGIETV